MKTFVEHKNVLILFYSFSSQTKNLINGLAKGLGEREIHVHLEQLKPLAPPSFPLGSYLKTLKLMLTAFLRRPVAVAQPDKRCYSHWDLVICAGPTWSYHMSGPMTYFLKNYSADLVDQRLVLPLISCRTYWRLHLWEMRRYLRKSGARVMPPVVFRHPFPGFWCAFGVFVKLAGKIPKSCRSIIQNYCPRYGHSLQQIEQAKDIGRQIAEALKSNRLDENYTFKEEDQKSDPLR